MLFEAGMYVPTHIPHYTVNNRMLFASFATTIIIIAVAGGSVSSSSSSSQPLPASSSYDPQRQREVQKSLAQHSTRLLAAAAAPKATRRDCTLQIIAYVKLLPGLPDYSGDDDDDDEVFECEIDPVDVPGNYAGLSRRLDLSSEQKRRLKRFGKRESSRRGLPSFDWPILFPTRL